MYCCLVFARQYVIWKPTHRPAFEASTNTPSCQYKTPVRWLSFAATGQIPHTRLTLARGIDGLQAERTKHGWRHPQGIQRGAHHNRGHQTAQATPTSASRSTSKQFVLLLHLSAKLFERFSPSEVGLIQPMGDDIEMCSCAPTTRSDALPRPHSECQRAPASVENGIVAPQPSPCYPCPRSFAEKWSPASTVRSTPPIDLQQMSPAVRSCSSRGLDDIELVIDAKAPVAKPAAVVPSSMELAIIPPTAPCGLVLPCPPSDAEKVSYLQTFRPYIVAWSIVAVLSIQAGLWLCTMASPFLYWLGVPSSLVLLYFVCYLAVASSGKDFSLVDHAEIVQHGVDQKYLPTVDVFLPVCNEPVDLIANTWKYVSALDYPNVAVHVLDDGAKDSVRDLAATFGFRYIRRDNRPELKKAGNLRYAFARTTGEAVVIFDADFCPRPDFLRETLAYLVDPSIGIVQTPQCFRWRKEQTWVEKGAGTYQELFYRMEQMNRNKFGASVCVGSCAVYRRAAVEPFGGVVAVEHSEDIHTGCKITEAGFKVIYLPLCLAIGVCPDEPRGYFMQQYRWCAGSLALVLRREFWMADISAAQKTIFFVGMVAYFFAALSPFLALLPVLILIWVAPNGVLWYQTGLAVPFLIFTVFVMPCWCRSFGCTSFAQRVWRSVSWYRVMVIQCYAAVFAIKDSLFGTSAAWVPSGAGSSQRSSSRSYNSSVRLLLAWNAVTIALVIWGVGLRMNESRPYDFLPAASLVLACCAISLSTLWY